VLLPRKAGDSVFLKSLLTLLLTLPSLYSLPLYAQDEVEVIEPVRHCGG
jgi:hypothetical protein